jgi:hypothetical protein
MTKRLVLLALVAVAVYAGFRWRSSSHAAQPTDERIVLDRLWIDHLPQNPRDEITVFAAFTQEPMGIHQATSQWRGKYEIFQFEGTGDELRVVYPQTGERETVKATARACDENGWEYCLVLKGSSRGVKKYYSMEGWEIGSLSAADSRAHALFSAH